LEGPQTFRFNRRVPSESSRYRFSNAFIVRLLRPVIFGSVALLVLLGIAVAALSAPAWLLLVGVVLLLAATFGVAAIRRVDVVRLDEAGYQVRLVRGAGVRRAVWRDVEDVVATTWDGTRCVVLRLRDGRSTTVPVDVLAGSTDDFVLDLQRRLNHGHGYRRLPRPS
jgi:hypothetical protein